MSKHLGFRLMFVALLGGTLIAQERPIADARVADLMRAGKMRLGLFLPQYSSDAATGEIRGDVYLVETARGLAERLGVELVLVGYPTPAKAMEGLNAGTCDVAFLGNDFSRANKVRLSPPVIEVDYSYLVPAGSAIRRFADADQRNIRIAVVRGHLSTLTLSRLLKHATLVFADTPDPTFDLLRTGRADAMASVAYVLQRYSTQLPGSQVLEGRYGANLLTMAVGRNQTGRLAYITRFVQEAKASGLVQRAIDRGGLRGIHVAPPGNGGRPEVSPS
jgi:polar amino acid transport system substrate-binding protein